MDKNTISVKNKKIKKAKNKKIKSKEIFSMSDSSDDEIKSKKIVAREEKLSKIVETPNIKEPPSKVICRKHPERTIKAFNLIKKDLNFTSDIFSEGNVETSKLYEAIPEVPDKDDRGNVSESEDDYNIPPKKIKPVNLIVEDKSKPISHLKIFDKDGEVILPNEDIEETCNNIIKSAKKINIGHFLPQKDSKKGKNLKFLPDDGGIMRKGFPFYHWLRRHTTDNYKARILKYNINITYGPFSEEEDEIIIKNWKNFCKHYNTKEEELFWYLGNCVSDRRSQTSRKEEVNFMEETAMIPRICKGLNNRLSYMVISRLKKLYSPLNLLSNTNYIWLYTKKEKDEIINLLKKYDHNISRVALEVNKTWVYVQHLWTLEKMKTDYPFYAMAYIYNTIENSSIIKMKKLLTGDDYFEDILKPIIVNLTREISDTTVGSISFVINAMREYVKEEMKTTKKFKKAIKLLLPWRHFGASIKDTYLIYINMRITNLENGEGTNVKDDILYSEIERNRFYINSPHYPKIAFDRARKKYKKAMKQFGKGIVKFHCGEHYQDLLMEKYVIENVLDDGEDLSVLMERPDEFKKTLLKYLYTSKKIDIVSYEFEPHEVENISI